MERICLFVLGSSINSTNEYIQALLNFFQAACF